MWIEMLMNLFLVRVRSSRIMLSIHHRTVIEFVKPVLFDWRHRTKVGLLSECAPRVHELLFQ